MALHAFTTTVPLTISTASVVVYNSKIQTSTDPMYYIGSQGAGEVEISVKVPSNAVQLYFYTTASFANGSSVYYVSNVQVVDDGTYKTYTMTVNNLALLITYKSGSYYYGYNPTSASKSDGVNGVWVDADLSKMATTWGTGAIHTYALNQPLEKGSYTSGSGQALKYISSGYGQYISYYYQIQGVSGAGSVYYLIIPPGVTTFTCDADYVMYPVTTVPTTGTSISADLCPLTPVSTSGNVKTYTIAASTSTQYVIMVGSINKSASGYCSNKNGDGEIKDPWT